MFRGTSHHNIDAKGRLIVPSRFRDSLGDEATGMIISKLDRSLVAYPYDEWDKIEKKILSLAEKSLAMRRFRRSFIGGAEDCPIDKQGRILIPQPLRNYAHLTKEVSLVGVLDHFEIWSREGLCEEERKLEEEDMKKEEVVQEIAKLGL